MDKKLLIMGSVNPELIQALQQAATHFDQGRLREAESVCRRIIGYDPNLVDAHHLIALVLKKRGDLVQAEQAFANCIRIDAGRADIHANLGNLLASTERSDDAADAYHHALSIDASFRPARLGLARLLNKVGKADEARQEAKLLIGQNIADASAWNILGTSERLQGRGEDAEAAFRKAIELDPNYAVARHNLGALLAQESRSEEALLELEQAASAGISGSEIDVNRASALMALNRFDDAETILSSTIRSLPNMTNAHTLLARLRFMRGNEQFADEYAAAVKKYPDDVLLLIGYSRVLRGAGLFDEATETVRSALVDKAGSSVVQAELAAIYQDTGQFDLALKHAQAAMDAEPGATGVDDILIDALTCLGRADEAWPIVQAARHRNPLNQWYVAMEASVARLLGYPQYAELYDYEAFVKPFSLPVPDGWSSIDAFHRDLIPALMEQHLFKSEPLDQSLRHGSQTPRGLIGHPSPAIQAFLRAIREPIAEYREAIGFDPDHPLRSRNKGDIKLAGCWSVRLQRGGYHVNHVHSEGWISSAYYVEVPPEVSDSTVRNGWIKFGEPRFAVPGATAEKFVQPSVGRLVLFPSYMWHGTTPISGDQPRMTIAFDVVPEP